MSPSVQARESSSSGPAQPAADELKTHYRMILNNCLAQNGRPKASFVLSQDVPLNVGLWHATVSVDSVEYGYGKAKTKGEAMEAASRQALTKLSPNLAL